MESLVIDKAKLINKIDNIIDELKSIKYEITTDMTLDEITDIEDVKESKFQETEKTLIAKPKQKSKPVIEEDPNRGYKDYYDPASRPEFHI